MRKVTPRLPQQPPSWGKNISESPRSFCGRRTGSRGTPRPPTAAVAIGAHLQGLRREVGPLPGPHSPPVPGTAGTTLPPSSSITAGLGPAVATAAGLKTEPKVPGLVILKKRVFAFAGPRSFKCSVMYKQINRWKKYLINRKKKKGFSENAAARSLNRSYSRKWLN